MPGDVAGERTYEVGAADSLTMAGAGIHKSNDAPGGVATIGQAFDYSLAIDVPAGTTLYGGRVSTRCPTASLSRARPPHVGIVAGTANGDGTTTVVWTMPATWPQSAPPTTPTSPSA